MASLVARGTMRRPSLARYRFARLMYHSSSRRGSRFYPYMSQWISARGRETCAERNGGRDHKGLAAATARWISSSPVPRAPSRPRRSDPKKDGDKEEQDQSSGSWLGGRAGAVGLLAVLIGKGKWVLAATKLTKLSSLIPMFISIGTYSIFYGWPYACGIVALIYVHEAGHALAMVQKGIRIEAIMFIPFMGAAVTMKDKPTSAYVQAYIALAGPVVGTIGSMVPLGFAYTTGSQLAFLLADFGFMVNLFNLAPIGMLDGGCIAPVIHPSMVYLGLAGGMAYMYFVPEFHPLFPLILLSGAYQAYTRFTGTAEDLNTDDTSQSQRLLIICGYFGLIGLLLFMLLQTGKYKKDTELRIGYMQKPVEFTVDTDGKLVLLLQKINVSQKERAKLFERHEVFTVTDDGAGGLRLEIPTEMRSFSLPPGTKLIYRRGGNLEVTAPKGKVEWHEFQPSVADALGIPFACIDESFDGVEETETDNMETRKFKINMKALQLESKATHEFWEEKVFFIGLEHMKKSIRRAREEIAMELSDDDGGPKKPSSGDGSIVIA